MTPVDAVSLSSRHLQSSLRSIESSLIKIQLLRCTIPLQNYNKTITKDLKTNKTSLSQCNVKELRYEFQVISAGARILLLKQYQTAR